VVASNSYLVGAVFPVASNQWQAFLTVDGDDPLAVYDAYVAQGRALGFPLPGSGATKLQAGGAPPVSTCLYHSRAGEGYPLGDPRASAAASFLECGGSAQRATATGTDGVELTMRWGGSNHHVALTFTMNADSCQICGIDLGDARAGNVYIPPADTPSTPRVRPRDRFGPTFNGFSESRYDRLQLERGTHVASTADRLGLVVLGVDRGDIKKVLQRYGHQMGETHVQYLRWKDARVPYVTHSEGDGGYGTLNADPTGHWILITTWSD
jgi:hypothetical protein